MIVYGAVIGGVLRYSTTAAEPLFANLPHPAALITLGINVLGSFLVGLFSTLCGSDGRIRISADMQQGLLIGFCGSLTTFSFFSLQALHMLQGGEILHAGLYIGATLTCSIAAAWAGYTIGLRKLPQ